MTAEALRVGAPAASGRGADSGDLLCVGALIVDREHRAYVHRRGPDRRLLPGVWDVVGGHVEQGETAGEALAREVEEETGWSLGRVEALLAAWNWTAAGPRRHEVDFLVEVDGDLDAPRLEEGKHDAYAWVGPRDLDLLLAHRADGDRGLREVVAKAVRTRITERLRLEPVGLEHVDPLARLHADPGVMGKLGVMGELGGPWSREQTRAKVVQWHADWDVEGTGIWVAFRRETGKFVGRSGVGVVEVDGSPALELGWSLLPEFRSRGYATEMGRAAIAYAFDTLDAPAVVAFNPPENAASGKVMNRLGLAYVREVIHSGRRQRLSVLRRGSRPS